MLEYLVKHGGCAETIHIIVTVDQDFFFIGNSLRKTVYRTIHVLHQKGVMKVFKLRSKKLLSLIKSLDSSLRENAC